MEPLPCTDEGLRVGVSRLSARQVISFSQLSAPRQALIRLCQTINYGYIQALLVRDSEPILDPPPSAFKTVNLASHEAARTETDLADFELRHELCRLLAQMDEIQNGTIEHVQIHRGLPIRIVIEARLLRAPSGGDDISSAFKYAGATAHRPKKSESRYHTTLNMSLQNCLSGSCTLLGSSVRTHTLARHTHQADSK